MLRHKMSSDFSFPWLTNKAVLLIYFDFLFKWFFKLINKSVHHLKSKLLKSPVNGDDKLRTHFLQLIAAHVEFEVQQIRTSNWRAEFGHRMSPARQTGSIGRRRRPELRPFCRTARNSSVLLLHTALSIKRSFFL